MDVSGEHQLDVLHSVYKTRLSVDGQPIHEDTEQYEIGGTKEGDDVIADDKQVEVEEKKCGRYHRTSACSLGVV